MRHLSIATAIAMLTTGGCDAPPAGTRRAAAIAPAAAVAEKALRARATTHDLVITETQQPFSFGARSTAGTYPMAWWLALEGGAFDADPGPGGDAPGRLTLAAGKSLRVVLAGLSSEFKLYVECHADLASDDRLVWTARVTATTLTGVATNAGSHWYFALPAADGSQVQPEFILHIETASGGATAGVIRDCTVLPFR